MGLGGGLNFSFEICSRLWRVDEERDVSPGPDCMVVLDISHAAMTELKFRPFFSYH